MLLWATLRRPSTVVGKCCLLASKGIYTVIAMEELIVVNGIVATPFGGINPTLANIYYNLHRLVYAVTPNWIKTPERWVQGATKGLWGILTLTNYCHSGLKIVGALLVRGDFFFYAGIISSGGTLFFLKLN